MNRSIHNLAFSIVLAVVSQAAFAQQEVPKQLPKKNVKSKTYEAAEAASEVTPDSGALQFKTGADLKNTDVRPAMKFKFVDPANPAAPPIEAEKREDLGDAPYRAYPGYPKNRLMFRYMPVSVASTWTYGNQDFSYNSSNAAGFGLAYQFVVSPMTKIQLDYQRYTLKVSSATVAGVGAINESETDVDSYFAHVTYCFIGSSNFFSRFCPGFDIGSDAYPLLDFTGSSTLELNKVRDLVAGVHFNYQTPLFAGFLLNIKPGIMVGNGVGNSGELTSDINSSYYLDGNVEWNLDDHSGLQAGIEYKVRQAEVSGKRGAVKDTWKSKITTSTAQLSYIYTF